MQADIVRPGHGHINREEGKWQIAALNNVELDEQSGERGLDLVVTRGIFRAEEVAHEVAFSNVLTYGPLNELAEWLVVPPEEKGLAYAAATRISGTWQIGRVDTASEGILRFLPDWYDHEKAVESSVEELLQVDVDSEFIVVDPDGFQTRYL